jgi:NADP-dependent 3-hydroxy acid dehydrogenase YdfG
MDTARVVGAGALDGISAAVATRFAAAGLHLAQAGRTLERLEQGALEIRAVDGIASVHPTDVPKQEQVIALFDATQSIGEQRAVGLNPGANMARKVCIL